MVRVEEKEEDHDADDEEVRGWTVTEAEHTARDSEAEFEEEVRGWMSRGRAHGT